MGAGTRAQEIRRRRERRAKRRKQRIKELVRAVQKGRTHPDRVKIAQEFWQKPRASSS